MNTTGKKIKKPIKKGVAKVPVIMQMEALECGAACLTMILAYYEKWIPLEKVRVDCGVSRDGSNAGNVLKAARYYGLQADGYKLEPQVLIDNAYFPCIIHWNFNHFVVLDGFRGNKAILNDPARGRVEVSMQEFDESFTGVCLLFTPGENFEPSGKPKSVLSFASKRLKGAETAIIFVVLTTVISSLCGVIAPGFTQVFMDRLLTGRNPDWAVPFLVLLSVFTAIQIAVSWINIVYSMRINGKLAIVGNSSFMWKILRLPMEFFSQRMAGDIQSRQNSNTEVASNLVNTFAPLALNTAMMFFYLVIMIRMSLPMTILGIFSVLLNALFSRYISEKRINIARVQVRDSGKLTGTTIAGIEMIESIKASGSETGFFGRWAGYQASVNYQEVRFTKTDQYIGLLPLIVSEVTDCLVLFMGIALAMRGKFTPGMITQFAVYMKQFLAPATDLVTAGQTVQEIRTEMERIEDVMEYRMDELSDNEVSADTPGASFDKLSGCVELKNVTFGYAPLGKPLIQDFNMSLEPGKSIAFVGASGSGKSTLAKLLSGLYKPWEGEILFDGKPIIEIDKSVFRGSLAVVDQDITLFEDTIANNIKMWDTTIENYEMILAARDAQIHDKIMQREGGYDYRIRENGSDFSGGERQRLEIARVLAQDPTIVILDEATSALDARTEFNVVKSIRDRGVTCIVIAHRLSTIRDCDEIIVMDHGAVIERGTHEELYALGGMYTQLVSNG